MSDFLAHHPQLLPLCALVLFFTVAVVVTVLVVTDRRTAHLRRMESLPLDDAENGHG
jgi:hypothetical protein